MTGPWIARTKRSERRGAVIVAALVCLLIVVAMLGALLQGTLRARRQLQMHRELRQCELLAAAGIDRAAYRAANENDYRGETWSVPADDSGGLAEGQVTIVVSRAGNDGPAEVKVVAEYPLGGEQSIRRSRSVLLPAKSTQPQE